MEEEKGDVDAFHLLRNSMSNQEKTTTSKNRELDRLNTTINYSPAIRSRRQRTTLAYHRSNPKKEKANPELNAVFDTYLDEGLVAAVSPRVQ